MASSKPMSVVPANASDLERAFAAQNAKIIGLMQAKQFATMPQEQQRLQQLKEAVAIERRAAVKKSAG